MGFLNPFLLIGVLSAAVPLLIHLWSRRQARTVDFPTLRFLLEAHRKTVRRFQLEQWLILALRMLALACIALALSRPLLRSAAFAEARGRSSVVIALDQSASMGYQGVEGVPFERAKQRAVAILRSLQTGDDASLVLMSDRARALFEPSTTQITDVIQAVESASLTSADTRVEAALSAGIDLLSRSDAPNKELYLIGDFTQNGWSAEAIETHDVRIFYVPVTATLTANVGVTRVEVVNSLVAAGIPTTFAVSVRNFGDATAQGRTVEFLVDGEARRSVSLDIAPGGQVEERFQHTFEAAGLYDVRARLDGDRYTDDDERIAVVPVLGQIDAMTVGDNPLFVTLALDPVGIALPDAPYTVRPTSVDYAAFEGRSLDSIDLLVLQDPRLNDGRLAGRVRNYLLNGGAVVLFLGEGVAPSSLTPLDWMPVASSGVARHGSPLKLRPAHVQATGNAPAAEELSRRVFGFFEGDPWARPTSPNFYRTHRLTVNGDDALPVATFSDGTPAVVVSEFGTGRIAVVNSPAVGSEWSNFPLNPAFLPFLQQLVFALKTPGEPPQRMLAVGQPYARSMGATDPLTVSVEMPDGKSQLVGRGAEGTQLAFGDTEQLGLYRLSAASGNFHDAFAVNAPPAESDFTPVDRDAAVARVGGNATWL
ncbi:MAG: BatA domain-containing protein, partial [Candidatus Poribacteria bacterium]|nr:BatA domain-containing protein [Candidatus Poribacteria bacterium]